MHLLSLLEVLLERVGEALRVLDELALPLLERLLARAARDVAGDLVHRVQQLLDGARDLPAKDQAKGGIVVEVDCEIAIRVNRKRE